MFGVPTGVDPGGTTTGAAGDDTTGAVFGATVTPDGAVAGLPIGPETGPVFGVPTGVDPGGTTTGEAFGASIGVLVGGTGVVTGVSTGVVVASGDRTGGRGANVVI